MAEHKQNLAAQYVRLINRRNPFLERGRAAACLTIPSVLPAEGRTGTSDFEVPYQSLGARGTNNLSNRLLLTLLPPSTPFFRLAAAEDIVEVLRSEGLDISVDEIDESLGQIEQRVMTAIEKDASRIAVFTAFKSLVIAGNSLLYMPDTGGTKVYTLDQYVVMRDTMGSVLKVVVREMVSPHVLDPVLVKRARTSNTSPDVLQSDADLSLYTCASLRRKDKPDDERVWDVWQELDAGVEIPESRGRYVGDEMPFIVLRMTALSGEDYGRGIVEEMYGDLYSLEKMTQAVVEASAIAARVVWLNKPNGVTRSRDIEQAPNGAVRTGDADDITALQLDKQADLEVSYRLIGDLKRDLGASFLLRDSIQRSGERVTATEIRAMIQSLEDALGGVFALLAEEFQLPLVRRTMAKLKIKLPSGVEPTIITGLDALGRNEDLNRLDVFVGGAQQAFGPEVTSKYIKIDGYLRRRATALGILQEGLVRDEAEVQAQRQTDQRADLTNRAAPALVKAGSELIQP